MSANETPSLEIKITESGDGYDSRAEMNGNVLDLAAMVLTAINTAYIAVLENMTPAEACFFRHQIMHEVAKKEGRGVWNQDHELKTASIHSSGTQSPKTSAIEPTKIRQGAFRLMGSARE